MPSKEFVEYSFNPEIGPGQTRFDFNGNHRLEVTQPIPAINLKLHESGIFPYSNPEKLPPPHFETATKILRNIAELAALGVKVENGVFHDRADNHGKVGERVKEHMTAIRDLVESKPEDEGSLRAAFILALRETPLIKRMTIRDLRIAKPFV